MSNVFYPFFDVFLNIFIIYIRAEKARVFRLDENEKKCYNEGVMNVYLDYAATTPLDKRVFQKMKPYLTSVYANPAAQYKAGRAVLGALDDARDKTAALLHASPSEVYFTASGSEADSWAIRGFAYALGKQNCKQILVSSVEHHALINGALALKREGFDVRFLPVTADGIVDESALFDLLENPTSLVCVMTANNEVGTLQPIEKIAKATHLAGAFFFTDAVQAAPYYEIDVKKSGADMLSISAHKFYGPKGMGALFIKKGTPMSALINGGAQERGLRGGTSNVAGATGLSEAFALTVAEREERFFHVKTLRDKLIEGVLSDLPNATLNGDEERRTPCNANFSFSGVDGGMLLHRLDLKGIAASSGSACAAGDLEPSHVLAAMGLPSHRVNSAVRFSLGRENTAEQIDYTLKTLTKLVKELS